MTFGDLMKLDKVKNTGVWVLLGMLALPIALSSLFSALTQVGLYHPPPIATEPRAMDQGSRDAFEELVVTSRKTSELVERHDELLRRLVGAQEDVSSAVKTNAITTGVLAQAIEKGFDRVEEAVRNHDNQMRRR